MRSARGRRVPFIGIVVVPIEGDAVDEPEPMPLEPDPIPEPVVEPEPMPEPVVEPEPVEPVPEPMPEPVVEPEFMPEPVVAEPVPDRGASRIMPGVPVPVPVLGAVVEGVAMPGVVVVDEPVDGVVGRGIVPCCEPALGLLGFWPDGGLLLGVPEPPPWATARPAASEMAAEAMAPTMKREEVCMDIAPME